MVMTLLLLPEDPQKLARSSIWDTFRKHLIEEFTYNWQVIVNMRQTNCFRFIFLFCNIYNL